VIHDVEEVLSLYPSLRPKTANFSNIDPILILILILILSSNDGFASVITSSYPPFSSLLQLTKMGRQCP